MIITPTSLTISQLFGSSNEQYVIPTYQRRYSWHRQQLVELIEDIDLVDGSDTHLLGSIVCLSGHHTAGMNRLELVDGQQRLTTINIVLECIRQRMVRDEHEDGAAEIGRLLSSKALGGKPLKKISLDSIDSKEYEALLQGVDDDAFKNRQMSDAFRIVRAWVADQSTDKLEGFLYRLLNQTIIIRLDVSEAKDAFKLFETINNRGLRLSPTDIIKNFLLGNAARFGDESLQNARAAWAEVLRHLDGTSPDAFFRHYLMAQLQRRVKASEVVTQFKIVFMGNVVEAAALPDRHLYAEPGDDREDGLEEDDELADDEAVELAVTAGVQMSFAEFLARLVSSARAYGEVVLGKTGVAQIDRHLRNLRMIRSAQTYGLLMHLRVGGCNDKVFLDVLKLTESFILRRHVCRERANETEALFAKLCGTSPEAPLAEIRSAYRGICPADDRFQQEFASATFPGRLIDRARYCLERMEISRHGEHDELQVLGSADVHVEHIIPQKIKTKKSKKEFGDWVSYLGKSAEALHPNYVSRIGNLTLFAGALNIGASNSPFARKKKAYKESSILLTIELLDMPNFRFKHVDHRSTELAKCAVKLWPSP